MNTGVLLLAHGAPERIEDVPPYLSFVRGGQPVSARVLEEVISRYAAIGGSSPLTRWTRVQAEALQRVLQECVGDAAAIAPIGVRPIAFHRPHAVRCPNCGSPNTVEVSRFGSTACKAQYRCSNCLEPFDYFKPH